MQTVMLKEYGKSLGTRGLARTIRNQILENFSEEVKLDFSKVFIISNALLMN